MKRKIMAVMLVSAMTLSLTACGGKNGGGDGAGTNSEAVSTVAESVSGDKDTLKVWCWDPNFNIYAIEKAAELYSADYEGLNVEISEMPSADIETKLTTIVSSGDLSLLPDVFLMQDNSFQKYVQNYPDIFTDLTDSGIDFSQFAEAKAAYSTVDGRHMGIPFDNGAAINCMRTDILEQAGFTLDDFTDITWSDYMEKAKVIKEKTGLPILTVQAGAPDIIMMMMQSCGASLFNKDGSVNIEGNDILKQCMEIYSSMVKDGTILEVTDGDQYIASLNNGSVASTINGCWIMASVIAQENQSGNWGITNLPRLDGVADATNYSNNGGSSWVITSNCKNKDKVFDFFKNTFAGSTEFYDDIISKGALATWAPAGKSEAYAEKSEFFGGQEIYSMIVDFATKTPSNYTGPFYYDARDAVGIALSNVAQQGADPESEMKEAQSAVEFNMGN
ncbi:ABC transporter substrate-binding protein [Novisyntrophococcus fermenticellae]|uniref:ABC transporter substrate-binding protein n=1 Tax=Novisyntrophococcus fermenticellae TaxID=2068655 RepID=UPI001E546CEE|nr:extracellular solute-binding protein [Novisyntrophococcus fermenticellae]